MKTALVFAALLATDGGNASWNSAYGSRGCSQPELVSTGGAGLLYCFVAN